MSAPMFDQLFKSNQSLLQPMLELNNIAMRLYGDVAREHIKVINELAVCHAEQLQQLSHAKRWEEMMEIQGQWAAKVSAPLNEYAQHMIDSSLEASSIYSKWMEKNIEQGKHFVKEGMKEGEEKMKEGFKAAKQMQEKTSSHHR